jgi:hypothetical protein
MLQQSKVRCGLVLAGRASCGNQSDPATEGVLPRLARFLVGQVSGADPSGTDPALPVLREAGTQVLLQCERRHSILLPLRVSKKKKKK